MAFHFKKKESPTKATRRLSRERLGKALAHLQKCNRLESVHSVRKEVKKMRAALGLVRKGLNGEIYRKSAKALRAAAKHLRNPRDAHVRPRTLERLMVHFNTRLPAHPFAGIQKVLRQNCLAETRGFMNSESAAAADRLLRKAKRRLKNLKVEAEGWKAIRPGVKESYRRGREAFEAALKETPPKNLHRWRKHVQDLGHQLRLLRPIQPKDLRRAIGDLRILSQRLGDDHDLVMLGRFVAHRCARWHSAEVKLLNELIELRHKELRSAALALGSRCFAEKPSEFCRRMETYWRAWRAGKKA